MPTRTWTLIASAFSLIAKSASSLPFIKIPTEQRRPMSGRLFPDGPLFVDRVIEALAEQPQLFPDLPVSVAELTEHQVAAAGWCFLHGLLLLLERQAADSCLFHQSEAIRKALLITRRVQGTASLPSGSDGLPHRDRQVALLPAVLLWHGYQQARAGEQMARKEARDQKANQTQPQTPQPGPPPVPAGKKRRRTAMLRMFQLWRGRRMQELGLEHGDDNISLPWDMPSSNDDAPVSDPWMEAQDGAAGVAEAADLQGVCRDDSTKAPGL